MSLDDALFLVDRGGINHKVKGSVIGTKIQSGDKLLVQRGDIRYHVIVTGNFPFGIIEDTDLILANDDQGDIRHVTGANFKTLFVTTAVIDYFRSNPNPVLLYGSYTLQWNVVDAVSVKVTYTGGTISTSHTGNVSFPALSPAPISYTLEATGSDQNTIVETVTVFVI